MAATSYGVNHALAVKLWSKKLFHEALKATYFGKFMGEGSDNLVQIKSETSKGAGEKITFGLRMQLSGAGTAGDDTLEGNEESLTTYSHYVLLDQLRHAVVSGGKMSEQRVPFSVREEARMGLQDWFSGRFDEAMFNQLAGRSDLTDTRYTGSQVPTAPTAYIVGGGEGAEGELDIVLTSRPIGGGARAPLAGIPYHAVENYLARLIEKGYHVAICGQVGEQPTKRDFPPQSCPRGDAGNGD